LLERLAEAEDLGASASELPAAAAGTRTSGSCVDAAEQGGIAARIAAGGWQTSRSEQFAAILDNLEWIRTRPVKVGSIFSGCDLARKAPFAFVAAAVGDGRPAEVQR